MTGLAPSTRTRTVTVRAHERTLARPAEYVETHHGLMSDAVIYRLTLPALEKSMAEFGYRKED